MQLGIYAEMNKDGCQSEMENEKLKAEALSNMFKGERLKSIAKEKGAICPKCGKALIKITMPGYGEMLVHEEKDRRRCKCQYRDLQEVEEATKKDSIKKEATKKEKIEKKELQKNFEEKRGERVQKQPEIAGRISMKEYKELEKELFKKELEKTRQETCTCMAVKPLIAANEKVNRNMKEIDMKKIPIKEVGECEKSDEKRAFIIRKIIYKDQENKENEMKVKEDADSVITDHYEAETQLLITTDAGITYPTLTHMDTGELIEITKPVFRIGKKPENEMRINDNPAVSRSHAEILLKNDKCYIRDIDSKNGTYVNGMKIPPDTEMEIKDGQKIKFANEEYLFHMRF